MRASPQWVTPSLAKAVRLGLWLLPVLALFAGLAVPASGKLRVVDVSKRAGIYDVTRTWGGEVGDINGDGWDDLFITNHYQKRPVLYRNRQNGKFARVGTGPNTFPVRDHHHCAFGDVDGDELVDIYCTIGGDRGSGLNPNELYMQRPNGKFENRARQYGVQDRRGRGRDVTFIDVDRDGFLDLYVGNKFPRSDRLSSRNKLFLNIGGEKFQRAPRGYRMNREIGGQTVEAIDYDGDGWDDLLVCGERRAFLFRNLGGTGFRDVSRRTGVDRPCAATTAARFDGDARPDIVIVTTTRLKVLRQTGRGTFRGLPLYKRRLTGGTEVAAGQVNRDARRDLYVLQQGTGNRDAPDHLLLNRRGGRAFRSLPIPQTRRGRGDWVASLDYDQNGLDDFLVLNGFHDNPGPVRLLATRR